MRVEYHLALITVGWTLVTGSSIALLWGAECLGWLDLAIGVAVIEWEERLWRARRS